MTDSSPKPPFTDAGRLKTYFAEKLYSRNPDESLTHFLAFFGVSDLDGLMAVPARTNSGKEGTMGTCWFGLFPFVDMASQWVEVDDVALSGDGYSLIFWGRWNGECVGPATLPNGETIDLAGKSFRNGRYAYRLTFSRETKEAILFEALADWAEWGRLMGSPEYAIATAQTPIYPA